MGKLTQNVVVFVVIFAASAVLLDHVLPWVDVGQALGLLTHPAVWPVTAFVIFIVGIGVLVDQLSADAL